MRVRQLAILGATGSIGRSTLEVVSRFSERYAVRVLTARNSIDLLAEQIRRFKPDMAAVFDLQSAEALKERLPKTFETKILFGADG